MRGKQQSLTEKEKTMTNIANKTTNLVELTIFVNSCNEYILDIDSVKWGQLTEAQVRDICAIAGDGIEIITGELCDEVELEMAEEDLYDAINVEGSKEYMHRKLQRLVREYQIMVADGEPMTARYDTHEEIEIICEGLGIDCPVEL